jgi:steroid delta-isomerase-like uncharacterized protein
MVELEELRAQVALEEQNKELIHRAYEAWNKLDIEAIREIYSPDFVWHIGGGETFTLEDLIEDLKWEITVYPDRAFTPEDLISKGNKVVSKYVLTGTHEGEREGLPPTGKKIEIEGIFISRVENGIIMEAWEVLDLLSLYMQLGYELNHKEEEKEEK